jgi:ribosome recycling factor
MQENTIIKDSEEKMLKALESVRHEFSTVRTSRATPSLLDNIKVDAYGSQMPIKQAASITCPEPRSIQIQPWDVSLMGAIEKAILKSDLGITPQNDGKLIRLNMPQLTQDRRKELVKIIHKLAEEKGRIAVRNIRRQAVETLKKQGKDGIIPEDEAKKLEKKMQDLHDKYIGEIDKLVTKKEEEIMEV